MIQTKAPIEGGKAATPAPGASVKGGMKPVKPEEKKTIEELAKEVIDGKWGNGDERKAALTKAGYDPKEVQAKVNELLK